MTASATPPVEPTPWYMSKTLWVGAATAILGVLDFLQTLPLPQGAMTAVGAVMIALRFITTGPISAK